MPTSDGYGIEVSYHETFFPEHSPARFSLSSVLHGQPPLDRSRRVSWVDLGCGVGLTACMVAAANPDIDVWGCDVNPVHIELSRNLATAAALPNCTFDEASFEQVAHDDSIGPATIDVAVIHGIYSWVSKGSIDALAEFLRRRLSPGGLVYLSHNTTWGWASLSPLAEAMRLHVEADGRRHDLAFGDAARAVLALEANGAAYFPVGKVEESRLRDLESADPRYAVHEYLVEHFRPVTFDEVADVMAHAKCRYIGSNFPTDHLRHLWAKSELAALIDGTPDTTLQQLIRDIGSNRAFRRDIFRRGLVQPTPNEWSNWTHDLVLLGLDVPFEQGDAVTIPAGSAELDPTFYGPLVAALAERPIAVSVILEMFPDLAPSDATAAIAMLVDGGYAAPESTGWRTNGSRESARRCNLAFVDALMHGHDRGFVVAPAIGAAVPVETIELLTLGQLWSGTPPDVDRLADHAEQTLVRMHWNVREHGEYVFDRDAARAIIEQRVRDTLAKIDTRYTRLGIW